MATELLPERCVNHKVTEAEILGRLTVIEEDVRELYIQLRGKVDNGKINDMVDKSTKEIEELKKAIIGLNVADAKHSESLAGIYQILKSFKETQDLMRQDYSKLAECYTQTSVHIASITAILAERAKKDTETPKIEVSTTNDPWYVRLISKSRASTYLFVALVTTVLWMLIAKWDDIVLLLQNIFGK